MSDKGRRLTDWNIPQYMGFKAHIWRSYKESGVAPPPDGYRVNPHNRKREAYWYEATLIAWREPRPKTRADGKVWRSGAWR